MKHVILVRHAKAVSRDLRIPDVDRNLVKSGKIDSKKISGQLKKKDLMPDIMISSHAARALETARIFAKKLNFAEKIKIDKRIYNESGAASFFQILAELENQVECVMFIGHDPTISEFASLLVKDFDYNLPKGSALVVELKRNSWKQIPQQSGSVDFFISPMNKKTEDRLKKFMRSTMRKELQAKIDEMITTHDAIIAGFMKKDIKFASQKLSTAFVDHRKVNVLCSADGIAEFFKNKSGEEKMSSTKNSDQKAKNRHVKVTK